MDAASQLLLQQLFLKESCSLLQYVSEADPWVSQKTHGTYELVVALAREEQNELAKIARFLFKHHAMPTTAVSFPSNFTTINMVALEHLLPFLIEYARKSIQELESRRDFVGDLAVRGLVDGYLQMKQKHL